MVKKRKKKSKFKSHRENNNNFKINTIIIKFLKNIYKKFNKLYSVDYWTIDVLSSNDYKQRNDKKFAYLFAIFTFSLVTGAY